MFHSLGDDIVEHYGPSSVISPLLYSPRSPALAWQRLWSLLANLGTARSTSQLIHVKYGSFASCHNRSPLQLLLGELSLYYMFVTIAGRAPLTTPVKTHDSARSLA